MGIKVTFANCAQFEYNFYLTNNIKESIKSDIILKVFIRKYIILIIY